MKKYQETKVEIGCQEIGMSLRNKEVQQIRYLTGSVIPEGISITLLMCLCNMNSAFITRIWVNTSSGWLLSHVYIPESCGQSFKPCPVFVLCCFCGSRPVWHFESPYVFSWNLSEARWGSSLWVWFGILSLFCACLFSCMKCKTLCLLSDKGLVSPRVKECFEWASASNSEEDPKLQVLKPFKWRDQWGLLSWLNWWRLLYWTTLTQLKRLDICFRQMYFSRVIGKKCSVSELCIMKKITAKIIRGFCIEFTWNLLC